jgi:hypothetical protein
LVVSTTGGWSTVVAQAQAGTVSTVKAGAGQLGGYVIYNPNTVTEYVFYYNAASPTAGSTTNLTVQVGIPAGATANVEWSCGITFGTGIYLIASSSPTSAVAPTTGLTVTSLYK